MQEQGPITNSEKYQSDPYFFPHQTACFVGGENDETSNHNCGIRIRVRTTFLDDKSWNGRIGKKGAHYAAFLY